MPLHCPLQLLNINHLLCPWLTVVTTFPKLNLLGSSLTRLTLKIYERSTAAQAIAQICILIHSMAAFFCCCCCCDRAQANAFAKKNKISCLWRGWAALMVNGLFTPPVNPPRLQACTL